MPRRYTMSEDAIAARLGNAEKARAALKIRTKRAALTRHVQGIRERADMLTAEDRAALIAAVQSQAGDRA